MAFRTLWSRHPHLPTPCVQRAIICSSGSRAATRNRRRRYDITGAWMGSYLVAASGPHTKGRALYRQYLTVPIQYLYSTTSPNCYAPINIPKRVRGFECILIGKRDY